ncbi:hypothetical protein N9Y42_00845 [Mariniblastus sp.]|nr:hypothetical protein [Mariniblastus sp.]
MSKPEKADGGLWDVLWRFKWLILILVLTVAGLYALQRQRIYARQDAAFQRELEAKEKQEHDAAMRIQAQRIKLDFSQKLKARSIAEGKLVEKRLVVALNEVESLPIDGEPEKLRRVARELWEKTQEDTSQVAKLKIDLMRSDAALQQGPDACLEHIEVLEEAGKLPQDSMLSRNSKRLSELTETVERFQRRKDQLLTLDNPKQATVQSIELKISEGKAEIADLKSQQEKLVGLTPEQVIQRFVVVTKQQVEELDSTLKSDLKAYRLYTKAETAKVRLQELLARKASLVAEIERLDEEIPKQQSALESESPVLPGL